MSKKCPYCCGEGVIYLDKDDEGADYEFICPACGGTRNVEVPESYVECPFCIGKGSIELENTATTEVDDFICPACHGKEIIQQSLLNFWEENV